MGRRFNFDGLSKARQVPRAVERRLVLQKGLPNKSKSLEGHTNTDFRHGAVKRLSKGATLGPATEGLSLRQQWEAEGTAETFQAWLYRKGLYRGGS